jgi:hypothetical protein
VSEEVRVVMCHPIYTHARAHTHTHTQSCIQIHTSVCVYIHVCIGEGGAGGAGWQRLHLTEEEQRRVEEEFECAGGDRAGGDGGWLEGTFGSFSLHIKEAFAACDPRNVPVILRVKIDGCVVCVCVCVCGWVGGWVGGCGVALVYMFTRVCVFLCVYVCVYMCVCVCV